MAQLYYNLPQEWQITINRFMTEELVCQACGGKYQEIDSKDRHNIGAWRCSQHPGAYQMNDQVKKMQWSCCGRFGPNLYYRPNGCVRADHTKLHVPYTEANDLPIPIRLHPAVLNLCAESIVNVKDKRESVIDIQYETRRAAMNAFFGKREFDPTTEIRVRRFDWQQTDSLLSGRQSLYVNDGIGSNYASIDSILANKY